MGAGIDIDEMNYTFPFNGFTIYVTEALKNGPGFSQAVDMEGNMAEYNVNEKGIRDDLVVVVGSDAFGSGEETLGKSLMKTCLYSMAEADVKPHAMIFINSGVFLTVEDSPVLDHLHALAEAGVEIYSCGACLDYYGLADKLAAGEVTNMYSVVELMNSSGSVIKL